MSKLDFFDITDEQIKNDVKGGAGNGLLQLQPGDTLLRIMPPWAAGKRYYKSYKMHFGLAELVNFGLEIDGWFSSPCTAEAFGKCPLCALSNSAKAIGTRNTDPNLLELNKSIRAKQQYAANAVDMTNIERGVQILPFGKKIYDDLQAIFARKGNVTHPVTGFNLVVSKREIPNQRWFDYSVSIDERVDVSEHWETFKLGIQDLDKFPTMPSYDDLQAKVDSIELIAPNTVMTTAPVRVVDNGHAPGGSANRSRLEDFDEQLDRMEA